MAASANGAHHPDPAWLVYHGIVVVGKTLAAVRGTCKNIRRRGQIYARSFHGFAFPSLRFPSLRFAFRRFASLSVASIRFASLRRSMLLRARLLQWWRRRRRQRRGEGARADIVAAIRSLLAPVREREPLSLSLTLFDGSLDLSLDFSLALSATRAQALSTMSLTSSCTSRVAIVCCIWRRWRTKAPKPPKKNETDEDGQLQIRRQRDCKRRDTTQHNQARWRHDST